MLIEIKDFPSDPNGETGNLRKELVNALQNADAHPARGKLVREVLNYASKQLTAIQKSQSPKQAPKNVSKTVSKTVTK